MAILCGFESLLTALDSALQQPLDVYVAEFEAFF